MDPISALSIASACATFLDFGHTFIEVCKDIREHGKIPELAELETHAKDLTQIKKALRDPPKDLTALRNQETQEAVRQLDLRWVSYVAAFIKSYLLS